jgi:hypothetical protein
LFSFSKASVQSPEINKFIFASESCIPIVPLEQTLDTLYSHDTSSISTSSSSSSALLENDYCWLTGKNEPTDGFGRQFPMIIGKVPKEYVWKADQWCLLSRSAVNKIIDLMGFLDLKNNSSIASLSSSPSSSSSSSSLVVPSSFSVLKLKDNPIFTLFQGMTASDEMFFPTVLSLLGYQFVAPADLPSFPSSSSSFTSSSSPISSLASSSASLSVIKRRITYADWSNKGKSPQTFEPFNKKDFLKAKEEKTLFFRKIQFQQLINPFCIFEQKMILFSQWIDLVYGKEENYEKIQKMKDFAIQYFNLLSQSESTKRNGTTTEYRSEEQLSKRQKFG